MPARATRPYSLDQAVTDEQEFWRHIGDLIDHAVEKALVKRGFDELLKELRSVSKTHRLLIERMNDVAASQAAMVVSYDKLVAWCTVKGADDDLLRLRLEKFFELVTPKDPPKTPP